MRRPAPKSSLHPRPVTASSDGQRTPWLLLLVLAIALGEAAATIGQEPTATPLNAPPSVDTPADGVPSENRSTLRNSEPPIAGEAPYASEPSLPDRLLLSEEHAARASQAIEAGEPFNAIRELQIAWTLLPDDHIRKPIYQEVMLDLAERSAAVFPLPGASELSPISPAFGETCFTAGSGRIHVAHAAPRFELRKTIPRSRLWAVRPQGDFLLAQSPETGLMLWSTADDALQGHSLPLDQAPLAVKFSPQGKRIVVSLAPDSIKLWEVATRASVELPAISTEPLRQATLTNPGFWLLLVREDGTVEVWDADTSAILTSVRLKPRGDAEPARCFETPHADVEKFQAVINSTHDRILLQSRNGTIGLWDLRTGEPIGEWLADAGVIRTAHFSGDGNRLALTDYPGNTRLFDARNGRQLDSPLPDAAPSRRSFFVAADRRLAMVHSSGASLWDLETGRRMVHFEGEFGVNAALSLHVGLGVVCFSDHTGYATTWDMDTGQPLARPMAHTSVPTGIVLSNASRHVVTVTDVEDLFLWDMTTGLPLGDPMPLPAPPLDAQPSADMQVLALALKDGHIHIAKALPRAPVAHPIQLIELLARQSVAASGTPHSLDDAEVAQHLAFLRTHGEPWLEDLAARNLMRVTELTVESDPTLAADILPLLANAPSLQVLRLSQGTVSDQQAYRNLASLTRLTSLSLDGTTFNDEACSWLRDLPSLERLDIANSHVTDAGLIAIGHIASLRHLRLNGLRISAAGLQELTRLGDLVELQLADTDIDDGAVAMLVSLSQLNTLDLARTRVTDIAVETIASLEMLRTIDLRGTRVSDQSLERLAQLTQLESIYLHGTQITAAGAEWLKMQLPACKVDLEASRP